MRSIQIVLRIVVGVAIFAGERTSSAQSLSEGLLVHWKFDGDYLDSSGLGHNLIAQTDMGADPGFAAGLPGIPNSQAVDFDNPQGLPHNGWLTRPVDDVDLNIGTNDWTLQAWINLDTVQNEQVPIEKLTGVGGEGWGLSLFLNGNAHFPNPGINPPSSLYTPVSGGLNSGEWHQFVVVRRDDEFCLITDGGSAGDGSVECRTGMSGVNIPSSPNAVILGRRNAGDGRGFGTDGKMDEVAIWGRGLSDLEIETLYNHGQGLSIDEKIKPIAEVSWRNDESGDWNSAGNWTPAKIPNKQEDGSGVTAIFGDAVTQNQTVFTDADVTIRAVQFVNSNRYVIAGGGSVSFESDTSAPNARIDVLIGNHEFQAPVILESDTDATLAGGTSLTLNNALDLQGHTLTSAGSGTLNINNNLITGGGTVVVNGGVIAGNGTVSGDLRNEGGIISPGNSDGIVGGDISVPEPSTFVLCGLCLVGLLARALRKRNK